MTRLSASGTETEERLYLDSIDAALRAPGRKGMILPNNTAEDALMRQVKHCEAVRRQLEKHHRAQVRANKEWVPDVEYVTAVAKNTDALAKALSTLERYRKGTRQAMRGLTPEQLDQVLRHNVKRILPTMSVEQRWDVAGTLWGENVANLLEPEAPQTLRRAA